MSNLMKRPSSDVSLAPSPVGTTMIKAGAGGLGIWALAALLPGGVFVWAAILIVLGIVF